MIFRAVWQSCICGNHVFVTEKNGLKLNVTRKVIGCVTLKLKNKNNTNDHSNTMNIVESMPATCENL